MALKPEASNELNLIGSGSVLEGKIRTPGSIRIDGRVVGEIVAAQSISIGGTGDVEGNVSAKSVTIGGKIKGSIVAHEKLVLENKAVIRGDIKASRLVIDEGAVFDGKCMMTEAKLVPNVVELKSEALKAEGH